MLGAGMRACAGTNAKTCHREERLPVCVPLFLNTGAAVFPLPFVDHKGITPGK